MFFNLLKHIFTIKKCKLLSDSFSDVKQDVFDTYFSYEAIIQLTDGSIAKLLFSPENMHRIDMKLTTLNDNKKKDVIIAKIKDTNVFLELIEVPEHLRNQGLGTLIFSCWLKVVDKISEVYSIQFSSISGTLGTDSNFTPEYSIKLYKKFNNYIFGNYKLRLDICDIKKRELLYTLILL